MTPEKTQASTGYPAGEADAGYSPPNVTFLGTLTELTQEKEANASDGSTFLGVDIGS